MKTEIYLTIYKENLRLIIEGDEHSVWAYVLDSSNHIKFDGFLCSRGTIIESSNQIEKYIRKEFQPPLIKDFANKFSIQSKISNDDIRIEWKEHIINIFIKEFIFLRLDTKENKSYSKAISKIGPYGNPLEK